MVLRAKSFHVMQMPSAGSHEECGSVCAEEVRVLGGAEQAVRYVQSTVTQLLSPVQAV